MRSFLKNILNALSNLKILKIKNEELYKIQEKLDELFHWPTHLMKKQRGPCLIFRSPFVIKKSSLKVRGFVSDLFTQSNWTYLSYLMVMLFCFLKEVLKKREKGSANFLAAENSPRETIYQESGALSSFLSLFFLCWRIYMALVVL